MKDVVIAISHSTDFRTQFRKKKSEVNSLNESNEFLDKKLSNIIMKQTEKMFKMFI